MRRNTLTTLGYLIAVVVFLVAATCAVLYATGYKIDWQARTIKKTGFMLIETYPRGANIKINGKDTAKTTPETIKRLLPENYRIELNKENYYSWQGDVVVASGLVTEKRNILLTFQEIKPIILSDLLIKKLISNLDNTKLAVLTGKDILLWDIKNKTNSSGVNASLIRQQIKDSNINDIANGGLEPLGFGPDNQTLLFQSHGLRNQYYLTLDTGRGAIKLVASGRNIINWKWFNDKEITWLQNNKLNLFNLSSGKTQVLATNIIDYTWLDNSLYVAAKNKLGQIWLERLAKNGTLEEALAKLPLANSYYIGKSKNNWLIIANTNTSSAIWLEEKSASELTWKQIATNVRSKVLWDDKYLIYKQGEQLMITEWEKLDQPIKIAQLRGGELIHFSFDTILYFENQMLKSIDLTGQNQYELVALSSINQFVVTEPQISKIVFIDPKTQQLSEATLREKTTTLF